MTISDETQVTLKELTKGHNKFLTLPPEIAFK